MERCEDIAQTWLSEMQECVRTIDYVRCHAIFAPEVIGFGTRTAIAIGLDTLERDQWQHIWGTIREFTFQAADLYCGRGGDMIWMACPWRSLGPDGLGGWVVRPGRITAVLERHGDQWLAVHTHHSLTPQ